MSITDIASAINLLTEIGLTPVAKASPVVERQHAVLNGKELPPGGLPKGEGASVVEAIAVVEAYFQEQSRNLQLEVEDKNGVSVISVVDGDTGDIVRQFPSEAILAAAQYIAENYPYPVTGVLMEQEG